MEDSKPVNIVSTFLVFILLIGLGFGGYFLGRYLDISANAKAVAEMKAKIARDYKQFKSDTLKIQFVYPSDWTVKVITSPTDVTKDITEGVFVTAPTGSQFVYNKITNSDKIKDVVNSCNSSDPNGNTEGFEKCTFVKDGANFARFLLNSDTAKSTDYWYIAEQVDPTDPTIYVDDPNNDFSYVVKNNTDLEKLDNIMKTVKRN